MFLTLKKGMDQFPQPQPLLVHFLSFCFSVNEPIIIRPNYILLDLLAIFFLRLSLLKRFFSSSPSIVMCSIHGRFPNTLLMLFLGLIHSKKPGV
ncbi:hypothetical protein GIB67_029318 [Kingdonia uniflora]|uniref:Uncharacterized protein n=1 Tax=Kingdonia uniflora TaxID=39325 RepID=A0A7J7N8A8_9MAGN|nr:hypothetical protein GIB67_029318 [Kingdonia uniflora]